MDAVEEVKARVNIEDLVGQYVDLKRSGSGLKGLCPFHTEKTPSFYVFPARGAFHCFGCGQGGDILTFVQQYDKTDFRDALRRLAARAGVELPDERVRQQQQEAHARLYQANEAALEFFRDQLKTQAGKPAVAYLEKRGVDGETQHAFSLGYAPDSRSALREALTKRGFTDLEMVSAGLVMDVDGSSGHRDRFHGRLMFPIRDARGRVTGFGGRILGDGEPKYMNSPQTDIFDKSRTLFALDRASETIRSGKRAVVVEGYLDAIRAHSAGFRDVVASLGTAITASQLHNCARLAPQVILALDPDAAGQAAAARTALSALAALPRRQKQLSDSLGRGMVEVGLAIELRVAKLPPGSGDPDELIAQDPELWTQILEASVPAFEFYFDTVVSSVDRSADSWRQEIIERVVPVIQEFPFALGVQAAWIERVGEVTGVDPKLLQNRLFGPASQGRPGGRKASRSKLAPPPVAQPTPANPVHESEDEMLAILLTRPFPESIVPALKEIRFDRSEAGEILKACLGVAGTIDPPNLDGLSLEASELAQRLQRSALDITDTRVEPAVRLNLATIRRWVNRRRSEEIQVAMPELAPEDRALATRQLANLHTELRDLELQMQELQEVVAAGRVIPKSDDSVPLER